LAGRKVNTSAPTGTTLFGQQQGAGLFGQGLAKPGGGIFTGGKLEKNLVKKISSHF
jgi:hypothetical protein